MNSFTVFQSSSGHFSAIASPSNVLVHSGIDPVGEADVVADSCVGSSRKVLLIGNGLGYLAAALARRNLLHSSVELYPALAELALCRGTRGADGLCSTLSNFQKVLHSCPLDVDPMIAPYVLTLRSDLSPAIAETVAELHVTLISQRHYRALIDGNMQANSSRFAKMKRFEQLQPVDGRLGVVLGSGPTLDASLESLHELHANGLFVAASGAVPALSQAGIAPDLIVAMEARNSVTEDMEYAQDGARVLVFPWTHPNVIKQSRLDLYAADEAAGLFTHGGSTGLAAADVAAQLTCGSLFLIGMEMSDIRGEYAANASRISANTHRAAPKFVVMRKATADWLTSLDRKVYHMIMPGCEAVHGASALFPMEFRTAFLREWNIAEHKPHEFA